MTIQDIALRFSEQSSYEGAVFDVQIIPGEVEVLQIIVGGLEEVPVFLSITDSQILCIVYLWDESEVNQEKRGEMLETMLSMNIPMPLSSFARIADKYAIFGAMAVTSSFDDIAHEVIVLSENSIEALSALEEFLV